MTVPQVFQRQLSKMGLSEALVDEVGQEVGGHVAGCRALDGGAAGDG
jgi:hypothetical protein